MNRKHMNFPSFLKRVMEDDFRKEIRIPNAFAKNFKKKILGKCILKDTARRKSWQVKIYRKDNNYYMCNLAWPKFVKDHNLKYGDYMSFWLVKKRMFEVIVYGADCNRKFDVPSDDDEEYSEDSSSDSVEGFESFESFEEDEDEDDNEESDDKNSKPSRNNSSGNNGRKRKRENKKEREETFDADKGYYRTDIENPYFVKKLVLSHETHMIIPAGFARETNMKPNQNFTLHGEDERKWIVNIRRNQGIMYFGRGWGRFFKGYKLKIGDTCKFTLLKHLGNVFTFEITS